MPEPKSPLSQESLDDLMGHFKSNPDFWKQVFDPSFYGGDSKEINQILSINKYIITLAAEREKFKDTLQMITGLQTHMHACLSDVSKKNILGLIRMTIDRVVKPQGQRFVLSEKFPEREGMLKAAFVQFPSPPEILKNPLLISLRYMDLYNKCRQGQDAGYNEYLKSQKQTETLAKKPVKFNKIPIRSSVSDDNAMQVIQDKNFDDELSRAHILKNLYETTRSRLSTELQLKFRGNQEQVTKEFGAKFFDELKLARVNYRRWRDGFINDVNTSLSEIVAEMNNLIEIAQDIKAMSYTGTQKSELEELLNETMILLRKTSVIKAAQELGLSPVRIGDVDKAIAEDALKQNGKKIQLFILEHSALFIAQLSYQQRAKYIEYFEQLDSFTKTSNGWELIPAAKFLERDKLSVTYTVDGKSQTSEFAGVGFEPTKIGYPSLIQQENHIICPEDRVVGILNQKKSRAPSSKLVASVSAMPTTPQTQIVVTDLHFTYPELDVATKASLKIAKELNKYVFDYPMAELIGTQDKPKDIIEMLGDCITAMLSDVALLRELEIDLQSKPTEKIELSKLNEVAVFRAQSGSLIHTIQNLNIDATYVKDNGGAELLSNLQQMQNVAFNCLDIERANPWPVTEPLEELLKTLAKVIDRVKPHIAQSAASKRGP